jgi:hypothetical protein
MQSVRESCVTGSLRQPVFTILLHRISPKYLSDQIDFMLQFDYYRIQTVTSGGQTMKLHARLILVFVFALVLSAASDGFAALYKYTDQEGMVCIANDLQSIPEKYRATAKIVGDAPEGEKKPIQQNQPQAQQEINTEITATSPLDGPSPDVDVKKSVFINRVLISSMVVVSTLLAFIILGILDVNHKKPVKILRVVILWGMAVYLIYAHMGDVVRLFRSTGNMSDPVHQKAVETGKKPPRHDKR